MKEGQANHRIPAVISRLELIKKDGIDGIDIVFNMTG